MSGGLANMPMSQAIFFRIDADDRKLIERAAKLDRRSVSDFVRLAAVDRAIEYLEADKKRKGNK